MKRDFQRSVMRIQEAVNILEYVGHDYEQLQTVSDSLVDPRLIQDKSYCLSVMLLSQTAITVARYFESINQLDIKRQMLENKLYTPEIGNKIKRMAEARRTIERNVACYQGLLSYRSNLVLNIVRGVPFENRYFRQEP
ncbi:hypothetical protein YOLOSWAG_224 [Erwinia phage vB_EamM_Yoloswag]|uniref:Uncharacterized protein n=1 Tax=Erwinia phage vB_EamM_Yoloswag TaxID=1958956 RepID=A0A1S6L3F0_9CAUD|nr:hypothetical protein HOR66_gp224 [Erwinia phage vB_EamM_Yoloswag]AQT28702.1 hypothetical protein YOLOSWAG_224 [Erwinia phage vB_EamM_Yoloswag]